ncbi:MAG: recombinase RecA [candidate division WOR-3 bacterium]
MAREEKDKALAAAIAQIEKQFGKGSVMRMSDEGAKVSVDVIPTGSLGLDIALGVGGLPRGRIIEVFGPEASGKTTLCLSIVAQAQKLGGTVAFIDAEHALDPNYAQALGVDIDHLLVAQPDTGEQALDIAEMLTRSGGLDAFVVDSVAGLVPRAEIEGDMGEQFVGLQARLMSQALRKLSGIVSKSNVCAIFTNQIRMKIGVMFGNPETTPGGLALKFHATCRLDVRRLTTFKKGDEVIGSRTRVRVVKNKVAPPFRQCEFDLVHGKGISRSGELIDLGVETEIVQKSGTWYAFGDMRIGQGRDAALEFLDANPKIADQIERKLREHFHLPLPEPRAPESTPRAAGATPSASATKPERAKKE